MTSRETILARLRENQFEAELPQIPRFKTPDGDATTAFIAALEAAAGRALRTRRSEISNLLQDLYPAAPNILSMDDSVRGSIDLHTDHPAEMAKQLETVDLFVCRGVLGVAENGAIWVSESSLPTRAALFATQHLALIIDGRSIVWNMHEAYEQIEFAQDGFGLFVCGPSKTADIEQSLVIGAHGPRSLVVFVTSDQ